MKLSASKDLSQVLEGILPEKLLYDKSKRLRNVKLDTLGGISPDRLFREKSIDSNPFMLPMFSGIFPVK